MTPYPSSQVSWVPTVATQPTASRMTPAPTSAKRPRIVALSSSRYRVPISIAILSFDRVVLGQRSKRDEKLRPPAPQTFFHLGAGRSLSPPEIRTRARMDWPSAGAVLLLTVDQQR